MTRYFVSYQPKNGQRSNIAAFDSMTMRAIWLLEHALDVEIIQVWEGR